MTDPFSFADELGPIKVIHVYEPTRQVKGILVVDNVAAGPAIGGLRMAPDVSVEECFRLARGMTLRKVRRNTAAVLEDASRRGIDTREAALDLARARVRTAMKYRRNGVFSAAPNYLQA